MTNISRLHLELLDDARRTLLLKLSPFTYGFILGGGTGLALQICHRKSFDFDFFITKEIPKNLLEKIAKVIQVDNVQTDSRDELTFFTKEQIKVTFLHYPFFGFELSRVNNFDIFTVKDIAVQKLYTIGRRGEYRDYFDLYSVLVNKYADFEELVREAEKIYAGAFDKKMLLQQLVYFKDMLNFEIIPPLPEVKIPTPDEVKMFFQKLVKSFL